MTLSPRRAASSLERLTVWLTQDDLTELAWDGSVQVQFGANGGPLVRVVLDDEAPVNTLPG